MRVLHTLGSVDTKCGGPARSVPSLVDALSSLGVEAALWTADGSSVDGLQCFGGSLLATAKKFRPEIMHDHGLWKLTNVRSAVVARLVGAKFVLSPRGMAMPWALKYRATKKRLAWALYEGFRFHNSACLHSTSQLETEQLRALGYRGPIVTAPNGIDIPPVPTINAPTSGKRKAIFIGRIHPKKGLPLLLQAWKRLQPDNWVMHVFGPDELGHTRELMSLIRQYNLEGSWQIHPELSDSEKWAMLADSELFILPSYSENFGITVAEALASAVPVITTDTTPWSAMIDHDCGWCVPPDVDALNVALADATSRSSAALRTMGMLGRDWMERDFSWQDVGRAMLSKYESLLRAPGHSSAH